MPLFLSPDLYLCQLADSSGTYCVLISTAPNAVELNLNSFLYQSPYCESGKGSLVWNTESVGTPVGSLKLGPVIADLSCQSNDLNVAGKQQSDEVQSSFIASLNGDGSYTAEAWFKPAAKFPSELKQQLKWLPTQPDGDGKYQFTYQGRL